MKASIARVLGLAALAVALSACSLKNGTAKDAALVEPQPTQAAAHAGEVSAEGRVLPQSSVWLSFGREDEVAEVLVKEGQTVEAGQVLARLKGQEALDVQAQSARQQVIEAQQALDTLTREAGKVNGERWQAWVEAQQATADAQSALDDLDTQSYQDQIDNAWVSTTDAQEDVDDAQEELDRYQDVDQNNSTRTQAETNLENAQKAYNDRYAEYMRLKTDLEAARAQLAAAQANEIEAKRQYEASQNGPDADDLALAQSRLETAQAQLAAAEAELGRLELRAPFAGVATTINAQVGELATPGVAVAEIADFSSWTVETNDLTELDAPRVRVGQAVWVTPDALPELRLAGRVTHISDGFTLQSGDVIYTAEIQLQESDPALKWGMTVEVNFIE